MKVVIDTLESDTGWVATDATTTATTWPQFSASYLSGQLQVSFDANGTIEKTFTADVSTCDNIAFNIIADTSDESTSVSDKRLKIKIWSGLSSKEFYVPLTTDFQAVALANPYSSITQITFTASSSLKVFMSELIGYTDEMTIDIYRGVKQLIDLYAVNDIQIGTISCSADTECIKIKTPKYIDRYLVFRVGTEYHQIRTVSQDLTVTLCDTYDGRKINATYHNEPIYLYIPVEITPSEVEAVIPGIGIAGSFESRIAEDYEYYSVVNDTYNTDNTNRTRYADRVWNYKILIEGSSRHEKIDEYIVRQLKKAIDGRNYVWVNGRRAEVQTEGIIPIEYGDATDLLSKLHVDLEIILAEENVASEVQRTTDLNITETVEVIINE